MPIHALCSRHLTFHHFFIHTYYEFNSAAAAIYKNGEDRIPRKEWNFMKLAKSGELINSRDEAERKNRTKGHY